MLHDVDLELAAGEVLAVLGASGAGKTTLLHTLAGFSRPTAGEIWLADELVAGPAVFREPEARRVGVVFQGNALWPHLDALATVAYPLRRQGLGRADAERKAQSLLDRLGLGPLAHRRPHQLSGGEQQRVGLARALARDAILYLLDEPTSSLDLPLREVAQGLIERGRHEASAAAVYTTHEAADALAVADRVGVLVDGRLRQVGSPQDVYERPLESSIARLTGAASILQVEVNAGPVAVIDGVGVAVDGMPGEGLRELLVRPGWATLDGPLKGCVSAARFHGPHTDHELQTSVGTVVVRLPGPPRAVAGADTSWRLHRGWLMMGGAQ
ncbi:MAG: ABC transporter ATP-binding protein [Candidatus Dormibacteraeota bacterium]|nr:ABC transporter ATP-binding protein [Candidatus Dormibacteraeota bacterium]